MVLQAYLVLDQFAFLCLITCTLCERTFFSYAKAFYYRLCPARRPKPQLNPKDFKLTELTNMVNSIFTFIFRV